MTELTVTAAQWKEWCQPHCIDLVVLFGSTATGRTHQNSDIDIALFSQSSDLRARIIRLYGDLQDLTGVEIDVAIIDPFTDPVLRLEICRKGKPLFESRQGLFVEQTIAAIKIFEDTEPIRRLRDQNLKQKLRRIRESCHP